MASKNKKKPLHLSDFDNKLVEYTIRFPNADDKELAKLLEVTVKEVKDSKAKTDVKLSIVDKAGSWDEILVKNRDMLMRRLLDIVNDPDTPVTTRTYLTLQLLQVDKLELGKGRTELDNY